MSIEGRLMRKVTVEFNPKLLSMLFPKDFLNFFETCDRVEGKAILKYDLGKGVKVVLSEIYMKSGFSIEDLKIPSGLTLLAVLSKTNNKYVCLVKTEYRGEKLEFVKLFDFKNIIFDLPASFTKEKLSFSFVGDNDTIKELLQVLESLGPIKIASVQNYPFPELDLLSALTERQKEIIRFAKKAGYYEIPRKIRTEDLSKKLGISKSTLIEHLRKAENRIVSTLFEGI